MVRIEVSRLKVIPLMLSLVLTGCLAAPEPLAPSQTIRGPLEPITIPPDHAEFFEFEFLHPSNVSWFATNVTGTVAGCLILAADATESRADEPVERWACLEPVARAREASAILEQGTYAVAFRCLDADEVCFVEPQVATIRI